MDTIPRLTDVTVSTLTEKVISPRYVRLAKVDPAAVARTAHALGEEGRLEDKRVVLNSLEHARLTA